MTVTKEFQSYQLTFQNVSNVKRQVDEPRRPARRCCAWLPARRRPVQFIQRTRRRRLRLALYWPSGRPQQRPTPRHNHLPFALRWRSRRWLHGRRNQPHFRRFVRFTVSSSWWGLLGGYWLRVWRRCRWGGRGGSVGGRCWAWPAEEDDFPADSARCSCWRCLFLFGWVASVLSWPMFSHLSQKKHTFYYQLLKGGS